MKAVFPLKEMLMLNNSSVNTITFLLKRFSDIIV